MDCGKKHAKDDIESLRALWGLSDSKRYGDFPRIFRCQTALGDTQSRTVTKPKRNEKAEHGEIEAEDENVISHFYDLFNIKRTEALREIPDNRRRNGKPTNHSAVHGCVNKITTTIHLKRTPLCKSTSIQL